MSPLTQAGILTTRQPSFNGDLHLDIAKTDAGNSDRSVADTIAKMGIHARNASSSSQVRDALEQAGCLEAGLTEDQVIERVFRWIKGRVSFVEDDVQLASIFANPNSKEFLITPPVLLSMPSPKGDCDDFSMLVCSMLMAKGIGCDFVTIAANREQPSEFSHVYNMARTRNGRVIPVDSSHGKEIGWEKLGVTRKQIWPVFNWTGDRRGGMGTMTHRKAQPLGPQYAGALVGILGNLGDYYDDEGNFVSTAIAPDVVPAGGIDLNSLSVPISQLPVSVSSTPSFNWGTLLPGIFGSVEKIALQTSQQPGTQQQVCNAQGVCSTSSTVLPTNYSGSLSVPSILGGSTGSILPIVLVGALALFLFNKS